MLFLELETLLFIVAQNQNIAEMALQEKFKRNYPTIDIDEPIYVMNHAWRLA